MLKAPNKGWCSRLQAARDAAIALYDADTAKGANADNSDYDTALNATEAALWELDSAIDRAVSAWDTANAGGWSVSVASVQSVELEAWYALDDYRLARASLLAVTAVPARHTITKGTPQ